MIKRIYLEITNACNLQCPFCENNKGKDFLSLEDFIKYTDEIREITPYIYLHVLGEPMFHPLFDSFMEILEAKKFKVQLVTNGTLLYKHPQLIKNKALSKIAISLHSIAKAHEYYLPAIDNLINNDHQAQVELRFYDQDNLSSDIKNYLEDLRNRFEFEETRVSGQYKIAERTYVSFKDFFKWPMINDPFNSEYGSCLGGKTMLAILNNGDVTLCCLDPQGHNKIGNLKENTLQEIIDSEQYKKVITDLNNNHLTMPLCQKCTYHERFL